MKKLKTIKRIITASLAVIITLTVFAAAPASASQLKSEATYGFISENKDFYEAHKDAMDHTASELLNMNPHVDISEYDLSEDEIDTLAVTVLNIHPELFYVCAMYGLEYSYDFSTGGWVPSAIVLRRKSTPTKKCLKCAKPLPKKLSGTLTWSTTACPTLKRHWCCTTRSL